MYLPCEFQSRVIYELNVDAMAAAKMKSLSILKRCLSDKRKFLLPISSLSRNYGSEAVESFKFHDIHTQLATEAEKMKKPDTSTLKFGDTFSDHMFEVEWSRQAGWAVPRIVPLHHLLFHPGSKVFHYAQALFEGMKAFRFSDGTVSLFRPDKNIERLLSTAHRAALPLFDCNEFLQCLKKLVSVDRDWVPCTMGSSLYIRPTFIGTQNSLGVHASNSALLYIVTCPVGPYFPSGTMKPVSLLADPEFIRAWPGGVGDKKMACNYAPSLYVQNIAEEQGLQQVLWLSGEDNKVTEVGAMNVFFFFKKAADQFELATPALDGTILPGVVRQSLLELARDFNEFEVSERTITMNEVIKAQKSGNLLEMFGSGTACSVCPVSSVRFLGKDIEIPTIRQEKPVFQRLYKALTDIQYGKVKSKWSVIVE